MHSVLSGAFCDTVETGIPRYRILQMLENVWYVNDTDSAKNVIDWLLFEGQEDIYQKIRPFVSLAELRNYFGDKKDGFFSEIYLKYFENISGFARGSYGKFDQVKSIKAWDLSRAMFLSRLCLEARLITQQQFDVYFEMITKAARLYYSSWYEFSEACLLGRAMYSEDPDINYSIDAIDLLINNSKSIWISYGWFR